MYYIAYKITKIHLKFSSKLTTTVWSDEITMANAFIILFTTYINIINNIDYIIIYMKSTQRFIDDGNT